MGQKKAREYRLAVERLEEIPYLKERIRKQEEAALDMSSRQQTMNEALLRMNRENNERIRSERNAREWKRQLYRFQRDRITDAEKMAWVAFFTGAIGIALGTAGLIFALNTAPAQQTETTAAQMQQAETPEAAPVPDIGYTVPVMQECYQTLTIDAVPLDAETQAALWEACEEYAVPYALALGIMERETGFKNVMGDDGASAGYMQVQARWHRERMAALGVTDLMEPAGNFRVALDYLCECIDRTDTMDEALMAYNMGLSGASACWAAGAHTSDYSRTVMTNAEKWEGVLENAYV